MPKQVYALSCICVGVGAGGSTAMLARVAVVDFHGQAVVDTFVAPTTKVTDYRTSSTGIEPAHLTPKNAQPFAVVQQQVANVIRGQLLVGHMIWNDLSVLGIPHPAVDTRDVALYQPFRNALRSPTTPMLQTLVWHLMRRRCQQEKQNPLENSRAALDLYRTQEREWEASVSQGNWPCTLPPPTFSRCYT